MTHINPGVLLSFEVLDWGSAVIKAAYMKVFSFDATGRLVRLGTEIFPTIPGAIDSLTYFFDAGISSDGERMTLYVEITDDYLYVPGSRIVRTYSLNPFGLLNEFNLSGEDWTPFATSISSPFGGSHFYETVTPSDNSTSTLKVRSFSTGNTIFSAALLNDYNFFAMVAQPAPLPNGGSVVAYPGLDGGITDISFSKDAAKSSLSRQIGETSIQYDVSLTSINMSYAGSLCAVVNSGRLEIYDAEMNYLSQTPLPESAIGQGVKMHNVGGRWMLAWLANDHTLKVVPFFPGYEDNSTTFEEVRQFTLPPAPSGTQWTDRAGTYWQSPWGGMQHGVLSLLAIGISQFIAPRICFFDADGIGVEVEIPLEYYPAGPGPTTPVLANPPLVELPNLLGGPGGTGRIFAR
jgi:hypothetical protein